MYRETSFKADLGVIGEWDVHVDYRMSPGCNDLEVIAAWIFIGQKAVDMLGYSDTIDDLAWDAAVNDCRELEEGIDHV